MWAALISGVGGNPRSAKHAAREYVAAAAVVLAAVVADNAPGEEKPPPVRPRGLR